MFYFGNYYETEFSHDKTMQKQKQKNSFLLAV